MLVKLLKDIPLPGHAIPLTEEDKLVIRIWHLTVATTFNINWQLMLPDGSLQRNSQIVTPTTDGLINQFTVEVGDGWLINLSVQPSGSYNEYTETYVKVLLWRGAGVNHQLAVPLIDNYCSGYGILGWPFTPLISGQSVPGGMVHVNVANPAAGADFSYSTGVYVAFELEYVKFILTTAVAAANRRVILRYSDSAVYRHGYFPCANVQAASLAYTYTFSVGHPAETLTDTYVNRNIARGLFGGDTGGMIGTFITNLQAADQISSIWLSGKRKFID